MIHVICIQWDTKYSDEYVTKLFRSIKRNTSKGFLFTCFSDKYKTNHNIIDEVDVQPLPVNVRSWFNKVGLYNKNLYNLNDQIFYFDLDTIIVGDLDEIFEWNANYIILRDFYRPDGFGSGLMAWAPEAVHHMWEKFTPTSQSRHGDQGWPEIHYPTAEIWQEKFPNKIISYKVHVQGKGILRSPHHTNHPGSLETASIVCFHGRPSPHEIIREPWVQEHWNEK